MRGKFRWVIITVVSLVVGLTLGLGGALLYNSAYGNVENALKAVQGASERGEQLLKGGDPSAAVVAFDEAQLQARSVLERVEKEAQKPNLTPDASAKLVRQQGEAFWLLSCALRDKAYAQGQADGHPLPEVDDTSTGEKFRSLVRIPNPEALSEAANALRNAAVRLPDLPDVQKEAIRFEAMQNPVNWNVMERICKNVLKLDPNDARANYVMARVSYEQPSSAVPVEKRSTEGMRQAVEYLDKVKQSKNYPYWRTVGLEAKIHRWLRTHAIEGNKPAEAEREAKALTALLFDEPNGALPRARAGDSLKQPLGSWDLEGVFDLHDLAVEMAVEERLAGKGDRCLDTLKQVLEFTQKMSDDKAGLRQLEQAAATAVTATSRVQPVVDDKSEKDLDKWKGCLDTTLALGKKALDKKATNAAIYRRMAQLLEKEAVLEAKRDHKSRQEELKKEAAQWVEDGLTVGTDAKLPAAQLAELHAMAAEMKTIGGAKPEEIKTHLAVLRESNVPAAVAVADLLDGALAERQGRLEKARGYLESAAGATDLGVALRAKMVLVNLYLTLGQPDKAVTALGDIKKLYTHFEALSPLEKAWVQSFFPTQDDVTAAEVVANLETGALKLARFLKEKPGQKVPPDLLASSEKAADAALKKLPPQSPQARSARQALVRYLNSTTRRQEARDALAALRKDFPDNIDVLRMDVALMVQPEKPGQKPEQKAIDAADARIQQFIKDYPNDMSGRLLWAEWLARTERAAKAVEYLQDPASFQGVKDERYQRVLAAALFSKGDREEGVKVLQHLPSSAGIDAMLIQAAASKADQEKQLQAAMSRHEKNGMFRCWDATLDLSEGKYAEAAAGFFGALEFSNVKATAQNGLQRALLGMAQKEPGKARDTASEMIKERPEEPELYLAYAYAALLLDDIGGANDSWDRRTMNGALNAWRDIIERTTGDKVTVPMTKAEFWLLANRMDVARGEVLKALNQNPKDPRALGSLVGMAIDTLNPDQLADAPKYLQTLKEVEPDALRTMLLEAGLAAALNKPAEAIQAYEKLVAKHPKATRGYHQLVVLEERRGEKAKAKEWIKRWREALPDDILGAVAEVRDQAMTDPAKATKTAEAFSAEQLKKLQAKLEEQKPAPGADPAQVAKSREEAMENARELLDLEMARAFSSAKRPDEALRWVKKVLDKEPDNAAALLIEGQIYLEQKKWPETIAVYEKILKRDPKHYVAGNNLAWILATQNGDLERALAVLKEVRKNRFNDKPAATERISPDYLDTLGLVYEKLAKPALYPEMRDTFEAARKRYPTDPRMALFHGHALTGLRELDKARDAYRVAISLTEPQVRNSLSDADRQQVRQAAQEAQAKLPPK